jgi:hypothetical protein
MASNIVHILGVADIDKIYTKIKVRQERFHENLVMSLGVVLMNYGDSYVSLYCVGGEWEGKKGDLVSNGRIPMCPNGHVLIETSDAPRLALIKE